MNDAEETFAKKKDTMKWKSVLQYFVQGQCIAL